MGNTASTVTSNYITNIKPEKQHQQKNMKNTSIQDNKITNKLNTKRGNSNFDQKNP
jgi:hypothetical protein